MLEYKDIDQRKKLFVFEFDNVLYPEKDYLLQIYYLFSSFIEFTVGTPPAADMTAFFKTAFEHHGSERIFDRAQEVFGIDERYRENFERLHYTARLPLKLLLYSDVLKFLQEIIIDRKQIAIVTNGVPDIQLNKIKQTEWNGIEKYLKVYYAHETKLKPETDVLTYILSENNMLRNEALIVGESEVDEEFASASGVDYIHIHDLINT